jgi:hypothetical protein
MIVSWFETSLVGYIYETDIRCDEVAGKTVREIRRWTSAFYATINTFPPVQPTLLFG